MQPSFPPPEPPKSRRGSSLIGVGLLLLIILVVGGAIYVFRDRLSAQVTELTVGACFDEPTVETEVEDVQQQPCNEPHDAEVIAVLTHPAGTSEPYPVVSGFDDYILENCVPAFESYLGKDWETDNMFSIGYFRPTLTGWADGDRGFTCYVSRSDGQKLTATVQAASPSST